VGVNNTLIEGWGRGRLAKKLYQPLYSTQFWDMELTEVGCVLFGEYWRRLFFNIVKSRLYVWGGGDVIVHANLYSFYAPAINPALNPTCITHQTSVQ
jgi:hypothetical protein